MNIFILVPVFNEGEAFREWLPGLFSVAREIGARLVVVDDGSFSALQKKRSSVQGPRSSVVWLRHDVNCGVGAAIGTGLEYAKRNGADMVLTIDGDGQHDAEDLLVIYDELKNWEEQKGQGPGERVQGKGANGLIVNGSRFLKRQSIPLFRRLANKAANVITYLLSGFWLTDSQSGMKGFSKHALEQLEIVTPGYEWCTDVFREANWYGFQVTEAPISVSYNSYTLNKGQNFAIGLDMLMRLMVRSLIR